MNQVGDWVRRRRVTRGLSQQSLASLVGRSARWLINVEQGRAEPRLSDLLELSRVLRADLGELLGTSVAGDRAAPSRGNLGHGGDDTKRRDFLGYVVMLGTTGTLDWDRLEAAVSGPGWLDRRLLEDLGRLTRAHFGRRHTVPPRELLRLVDGHLTGLRGLLGSARSQTGLMTDLSSLTSETAWLAGWLSYRAGSRVDAHAHAAFAEALAIEARDGQRRALALSLRAHLHSSIPLGGRGGDSAAALAILNEAVAASGEAAPPGLRTELLARRAEEHATAADAAAARRDLELAEQALAAGANDDDLFGHWNAGLLAGFRGHCAHLLRQPREAAVLIERALAEMDPSLNRSVALADLGAAHADSGEVERACTLLVQALDVAGRAGLTFTVQRVAGIRARHLAAGPDAAAVRQLDERLRLAW